MATITSNASGDWWTGATWVGGVVPVDTNDVIIATGHTIVWDFGGGATIPATGTLVSLTGQGTGTFTINQTDGVRTLDVTTIQAGATAPIVETTGGTNSLTMVGNLIGGTGSGGHGFRHNGTGAIIITGDVTGGSGSSAFGIHGNSAGSINITGTVTGGGASSAYGFFIASSTAATITGNIVGGTHRAAPALNCTGSGATCVLNLCNIIASADCVAYWGKPPTWNNPTNVQYIQMISGGMKYTPLAAPVLGGPIS